MLRRTPLVNFNNDFGMEIGAHKKSICKKFVVDSTCFTAGIQADDASSFTVNCNVLIIGGSR